MHTRLLVIFLCCFLSLFAQAQKKELQKNTTDISIQERKLAELREQDSLRNLMETGNYDKKKWVFNTSIRVSINEDGTSETKEWVNVSRRVDYIHNLVGEGATPILVLLALLVAVILVWIMSKKIFSSIGKGEAMFIFELYLVFIQSTILYFMFSSLYADIDELIVRNTGKEYVAVYSYDGFSFVTADSIAVVVKSACSFDGIYSDVHDIPVRFDESAMKLAVDMRKYTLRNWNWILFIGLLLLLDFLFCYGKFNWLLKKVVRPRQPEYQSPYQSYISFSWHFKNKLYEEFDQFKKELKHFQMEWDIEDDSDNRYVTPRILLQYNGKDTEKTINFEIEIRPDNGESICMDEWMYKLQNELVPYMERLGEPDTVGMWINKGWTAGKEMKCELSFCSSLDDDDVLFADIAWEFTETEYTDYRTFIKDVMAFQSAHGKHFWNPDVVVVKRPSFTLCYYNPQTEYMEVYDMEADNGVTMTEGEILYKLHNRMRHVMPGQDFCYLQYLVFRPVEADSLEELEEKQKDKDIYDLFTTNEI